MGTWFPIGPDFVSVRRDYQPPTRLSRRNEYARQAKVLALALDKTIDPPVIYTVESPFPQPDDRYPFQKHNRPFWPVGGTVFRSADDGRSWASISDQLAKQNPSLSPSCVATHPSKTGVVFLGGSNGDVTFSTNAGSTWSPPINLGAPVVQLVVDPRQANNPATTTVYAAAKNGLHVSADGGTSWTMTSLQDKLTNLAFHLPINGTASLYAGAMDGRVHHATSATGPWSLLSGTGSGLPTASGKDSNPAMIAVVPNQPGQVYVALRGASGADVYTSSTAPSGFAKVNCAAPAEFDTSRLAFSVTPDSPGDSNHDVLFLTALPLYRSNDGGQSWRIVADSLHGDHNCIAYAPGSLGPRTYVGCDGGLFVSGSLASPSALVDVPPSNYNDQQTYDSASTVSQNYNHGKLSLAIACYAADPRCAAYGYAGAQDTGHSSHTGTLGWRGLSNGDGWGVAAHIGTAGLTSWLGLVGSVQVMNDRGEANPAYKYCFPTGNTGMSATTHLRVAADGRCLMGVSVSTVLKTPVTSGPTAVEVTPASMAGIGVGITLLVGDPYSAAKSDVVVVESVTPTTFTAQFDKSFVVGEQIKVFSGNVVAVGPSGTVTVLGPTLGHPVPKAIAPHPSAAGTAVVITSTSMTDQGAWISHDLDLGPTATWTEIVGGEKPTGGLISTAVIDSSGAAYALLTDLSLTQPNGSKVTTPLYRIDSGQWIPQDSVNLPSGQFGCVVARPGSPGTLYISSGAEVYEVVRSGSTWTWTNIGPTGLPGQAIVDLWIGDVGTAAAPKVLLRAAVVSRGVWEVDVTSGASTPDPPTRPYFRHQALDMGWLSPSIDGQVDPFRPEEGQSLYHWESPDIKIDAKNSAGYFQTDPEEPLPISHGAFDRLIDASESLPETAKANVHVQIHNRSYTRLDNVSVWAIYCHFSGALPSLAASKTSNNAFDFWSQFHDDGSIVPNLPADSPWKAVKAPSKVSGLDVAHPQVASFAGWDIPQLGPNDAGHYCMVAFAHSKANPISETSMNVDAIAVSNPQVAQRNVHVAALTQVKNAKGWYGSSSFIELHNPSEREVRSEILVDLRGIPTDVRAFVHLTDGHQLAGHLRVIRPDNPGRTDKELHSIADWLRGRSEKIRVRHLDAAGGRFRGVPRFTDDVAVLDGREMHSVTETLLRPHRSLGATIVLATRNVEVLQESFRFQVVQSIDGEVVGGATCWVRPRTPAPLSDRAEPPFEEPVPIGNPWV